FARAALGKSTSGLLFSPGPCLTPQSLRSRIKRSLVRAILRTGAANVITIIPFDVEPRLREVASGWIDDAQLWDLDVLKHIDAKDRTAKALSDHIEANRGGRQVIAAVGRQISEKG